MSIFIKSNLIHYKLYIIINEAVTNVFSELNYKPEFDDFKRFNKNPLQDFSYLDFIHQIDINVSFKGLFVRKL